MGSIPILASESNLLSQCSCSVYFKKWEFILITFTCEVSSQPITPGVLLRSTIFISSVSPEVDLSAPSWVASHGSYFCRRTEDRGARSDNGGVITEESPDHPPVKSSDTLPAPLLCIAHWLDDAAHALIWCFLTWEQSFPAEWRKHMKLTGVTPQFILCFVSMNASFSYKYVIYLNNKVVKNYFIHLLETFSWSLFSFYIFIYCHFHSVSH